MVDFDRAVEEGSTFREPLQDLPEEDQAIKKRSASS